MQDMSRHKPFTVGLKSVVSVDFKEVSPDGSTRTGKTVDNSGISVSEKKRDAIIAEYHAEKSFYDKGKGDRVITNLPHQTVKVVENQTAFCLICTESWGAHVEPGLSSCGHICLCTACHAQWYRKHTTCPICRHSQHRP